MVFKLFFRRRFLGFVLGILVLAVCGVWVYVFRVSFRGGFEVVRLWIGF